jgi:hypothetical protein
MRGTMFLAALTKSLDDDITCETRWYPHLKTDTVSPLVVALHCVECSCRSEQERNETGTFATECADLSTRVADRLGCKTSSSDIVGMRNATQRDTKDFFSCLDIRRLDVNHPVNAQELRNKDQKIRRPPGSQQGSIDEIRAIGGCNNCHISEPFNAIQLAQ